MKKPKQFSRDDAMAFVGLHRAVMGEKFKAALVKQNTALIPRGQEIAAELEAIAQLLENEKNGWILQKLAELGYPPKANVSIDIETGFINS